MKIKERPRKRWKRLKQRARERESLRGQEVRAGEGREKEKNTCLY